MKNSKKIFAAKGKKFDEFVISESEKSQVLKKIIGPSGNLRAPSLKIKDIFIVGFNADLYEKHSL